MSTQHKTTMEMQRWNAAVQKADMLLSYPQWIKGGNGWESPAELFQKLCRNDHHAEARELAEAGKALGYFHDAQFTVDKAKHV